MKITPLTTKEIRQFTEKQVKIRINVNMLVQQICGLREETSEEKKFKLRMTSSSTSWSVEKKMKSWRSNVLTGSCQSLHRTFYKKKLKECSDAAQVKELLHQMSVG